MDNDQALLQLRALLPIPGALQIITAEHRCHGGGRWPSGGTDPKTPDEDLLCRKYEVPVEDPRHFVCHQVTEIRPHAKPGFYVALTAEGDLQIGEPASLLHHLTRAGRARW